MKKTAELIKNISEGKNLSFEESKSIFLSIILLSIDLDTPLTVKIGFDLNFKILNFFTEDIASFDILLVLYFLCHTWKCQPHF